MAIDNLVVIPRALVIDEFGFILASKEVDELVLVDILQQFLFVATSDNLYFLSGFLVKPSFDKSPDSSEKHGSVYNHHLAKLLGVKVLSYLRSVLYKGVHSLVHHADRKVCHIEN